MPEGEIDHIDELQKHLYARDPENIPKQKYGILRPLRQNVNSAWGDTNIPKEKVSQQGGNTRYKRFFFVSLIFFLVAGGFAAYSVFRGAVTLSSKNVEVSILGNSFAAAGEELSMQFEVVNKNSSDLLNAELIIQYPKGAIDETGSDVTRLVQSLGTIGAGKTKESAATVVLYGEQGTTRTITAMLTYKLANATATFQKKETFSVTISSSPILLTIAGPSVSAANQTFTLSIRSLFTGDRPLPNGIIRVEYPSGYTFQSAVPTPTHSNNVWDLHEMQTGGEQTIQIKGKLSGIEKDERSFRVYIGSPTSPIDFRIGTAYNSALHTIVIEQPFIGADIYVGGKNGDIIALPMQGEINGTINWTNALGVDVVNPTFTLSFSGDVDMKTVKAKDAYVDELNRTITWNADSNQDIASIQAGSTGQFTFSASPVAGSNGDIGAALSVSATVPSLENEIKSITNLDEVIVRYAAKLQFAAQALYSVGSIKNSGPYPPKANQETSYTITWTARPTDNPLSSVVAKATLAPGVTWAGVIVPQAENISYNPETRLISWSVGSLPKATNVPLSKTVSFQVKLRPTADQVSTEPLLLSETTITATDAVANVPLSETRPEITTELPSDPIYTRGSGVVLP